ncbi:group-specific component (vitamin D binding protein) S homeolog precursor [Xenopus laevis]|uniref:Vitamin D-binding protein n=2 Tax=Xenopus laevis TaxID=8355 RepID=Q5XGP6_XENLA|nr:group-specific component (vitamin D binding protein) S homeolog precursor [Xenopus laevis]AAH84387.1 LOC495173 protein [Xenopus laevis]OCT97286.1 hypothetical protein XELAEV_18009513mg [Xenopus laevis]
MRRLMVLLLAISMNYADERGKPYQKDKVCQELQILGKDKFSSIALIMNSRKYSNATFEEIGHLVTAIVSLAETCCAKEAAADCYDKKANALSAQSCDPKSPFPKHPGVERCCVHKGLERKLCLADLKQPPKEFPTYTEPSNEKLCESFKENAQVFSSRFLYDYSSNYAQTPFLVVVNSTEKYLKMIIECCTKPRQTQCFLKQRLQIRPVHLLTVMSNRLCGRYNSYGEENFKIGASIRLSQKIPSAELKEVMPLVEQCGKILAKCCNTLTDDCMENELSVHVQQICKKFSSKEAKVAECCKKSSIEILLCLYSLPSAEPVQLPTLHWPSSDQLCKKGKNQEIIKYILELARRNTKMPILFINKLHDSFAELVNGCCFSQTPDVCLESKKSQLNEEMNRYISQATELCADYHKYPFLEFKEKLSKALSRKVPKLSTSQVEEMVEARSSLASTCCLINAPPVYCREMINKFLNNICLQESCLLQ